MILEQRMPPKLANETKRIALVVDAEWLKRIAIWRRQQPDPCRPCPMRSGGW
jgi:hypothetical protein